tara:strand:+ start:1331 stop:1513 length:183 start_codon:yes stop_codon:yes gene_type:complete
MLSAKKILKIIFFWQVLTFVSFNAKDNPSQLKQYYNYLNLEALNFYFIKYFYFMNSLKII